MLVLGLVATSRRALESARRTAAELNPEALGPAQRRHDAKPKATRGAGRAPVSSAAARAAWSSMCDLVLHNVRDARYPKPSG